MPILVRSSLLLILVAGLVSGCQPSPVSPVPSATAEHATGISGSVLDPQGRAADGAFVYAYRSARSNLRGPADFEARVAPDGRYFLDLVDGSYHLVARRRQTGADAGPPRPGDAWALPPHNPVLVSPGTLTRVDFVLQGVAQPMLMREGTLTSGDTGFTGQLVDPSGHPVPGAFVIAYPDHDFQRMPEATSPAVGEDGRFILYVDRPGQWCLAARTRTRGQPIAGELYGVLGEGAQSCRAITEGQLLEVGTIRLSPYKR